LSGKKVMNWALLGVRSPGADKTRLDSLYSYVRLLVMKESRILSELCYYSYSLHKRKAECKTRVNELNEHLIRSYRALGDIQRKYIMAIFTIKQQEP
jgi:hypothetical protein